MVEGLVPSSVPLDAFYPLFVRLDDRRLGLLCPWRSFHDNLFDDLLDSFGCPAPGINVLKLSCSVDKIVDRRGVDEFTISCSHIVVGVYYGCKEVDVLLQKIFQRSEILCVCSENTLDVLGKIFAPQESSPVDNMSANLRDKPT